MSWKETFNEYPEAEGVDFVSLIARPWKPGTIYETLTKEQLLAGCGYPRSNWLLWKTVDGKKEYIYQERHKITPGSVPYHPEQRVLYVLHNWTEDCMVGAFESRQIAEEMCVAYTEEAAYQEALEMYQWHHHWEMERAVKEAWKRHAFEFWIEEVTLWNFSPF